MGFLKSFVFAFRGIISGFSGRNFRIQFVAAILAVMAGLYLGITMLEWSLIVICIIVVLAAELFNTALEKLCDKLHPDIHPEIGSVKDLAAGAVLLLSIGAAAIGVLIFGWRILFFVL